MKQMKFYGMHAAFKTAIETGRTDSFTADEMVAHLIDHEHDDRHARKIERLIRNARFRYKAALEKMVYSPERNLDKTTLMRLADCSFISRGENLLITGSTGVGKSYIASALGHHACSLGFKVLYSNLGKLMTRLKMAKADGSYVRETGRIERHDLLILDDLGLNPIDKESRQILMDIIEDRHDRGSIIITSQLPVANWYELIGEKTLADAIMDRLVHNAHRIELKGDSMRRKRPRNNNIDMQDQNN